MLVCPSLKILFAHAGRTAGSSITAALRPWTTTAVPTDKQLSTDDRNWQHQWHSLGDRYASYSSIEFTAGEKLAEGYRIVASVRNPWRRVASAWSSRGIWSSLEPRQFIELLEAGKKIDSLVISMLQPVSYSAGPDPWYVIRYENLQENWADLCNKLDISETKLPHVPNIEPARVELDEAAVAKFYADPYCVDWVAKKFAEDIELYDYDPPSPSRKPLPEMPMKTVFSARDGILEEYDTLTDDAIIEDEVEDTDSDNGDGVYKIEL